MMEVLMDQELIEQKISRYSNDIHACINKGFKKAQGAIKPSRHVLSPTSRANIIRDFIVNEAQTIFPAENVIRGRGNIILIKFDGFLIRFKKLDKRRLAGNIQTLQAINFSSQSDLPGCQSSIHLNAGYVLDETKSSIKNIFITCPSSQDANRWSLDLNNFIDNKYKIPIPPIVQFAKEQEEIQPKVSPKAKKARSAIKAQNE